MKKIQFHLFSLVILVTILVFAGCSKDSNPVVPTLKYEATLTLNGAGYTNKVVTLSNGLSAYSSSDTTTVIQFSGKVDSDSILLSIIFKGNQSGTYNWNGENGTIIMQRSTTANNFYVGITQGTTTVSSYGAVNSKVEGRIDGKLIEATSATELNIVSGNFSGLRIPDID